MDSSRTVILGVDPGLGTTGYGLIAQDGRKIALIEGGTIEGGKQSRALPTRLRHLFDALNKLILETKPDAMAMEQLYSHYAHPRTAILMGHARGVLSLAAALHDVPVFDYAATEVKSSLTGNGRASKAQMQRGIQNALGLPRPPEPADVADALAVALCHAHRSRGSRST